MTDMTRVFGDFESADPAKSSGGGTNITVHGSHTVEITAVRYKDSEQHDAVSLIAEYKVLASNHDSVIVGSEYGWAHNMLNKWYGASNTKQFIGAALGMEKTDPAAKAITREVVEEAWGESQPLTGQILNLKTTPKVSKGGYDFVVHDWTPSTGEE